MKTCLAAMILAAATLAAPSAHAQRTSYAAGAGTNSRYSGYGAAAGSRLPFSSNGRAGAAGAAGAFGGAGGMSGAAANPFGNANATGNPFSQAGAGALGQQNTALGQIGGQQFERGGFVGRDAEDVRGTFENLSGRQRRDMMMDMMVENYNEMRESRRRWRDQESAPSPVRVRLKPAPELVAAARSFARPNAEVQSRINQALASRGIGAEVVLSSRTAILRGVVASERDALLMAQLASLEPGVSAVENQLTVASPPAIPPQPLDPLP